MVAGEDVPSEDKFKYIDDLATLEAVKIQNKLIHYEYLKHVPSDIPTEQGFLPADTFKSQHIIDDIVTWTTNNKMKLNVAKTKYMVLSRSHEEFSTRLTINQKPIERTHEMIHLGVWVTSDLTWEKNTTEICKRAYSRIKMLTKLKFVGVRIDELMELY